MMLAALAMLVSTLAGTGCVLWMLARDPDQGLPLFCVGAGFFAGVGLVSLAQITLVGLGYGAQPLGLLVALALVGVVSLATWFRRYGGSPGFVQCRCGRWWALASGVFLILLSFWVIAEGLSRPVFPWDAWSAWSVKAKVWTGLGQYVDFVSFSDWLVEADALVYTTEAWQYPELVPLYQWWLLGLDGGWSEPVAMLPWTGMWLALCAAFAGGLRVSGAHWPFSLAATSVVLATPVLAVQIALPGYMDAWLASLLLIMLIIGLYSRNGRGYVCLVLFAALLVATKVEGLLWAMVALVAVGLGHVPMRVRRGLYVAVPAVMAIWFFAGGFSLSFADATVIFTPDVIELPYIGRVRLGLSNPTGAIVDAFAVLPNWNLVWYVLPAALLFGLPANPQELRPTIYAFIAIGASFLGLVFYGTHASLWVESMTASNRLALQFMVSVLFLASAGIYRFAFAEASDR